ncbi:MAG: glutamate dehydrogenase [Sulfurimonas sp.]|nr:MAG: glutamate dehydrogenase [Sulfurimonas sp.]
MTTELNLEAVCSQLLNHDDITMDPAILNTLKHEHIVVRIALLEHATFIRIFALKELYLSDIMPILHDFGFTIVDELSYRLEDANTAIYVTKFNLALEAFTKIRRAKNNIESIITDALLGKGLSRCKIFSLVYEENFSIREVSLLRAIIEYLNQSILAINHNTILHTLMTHHQLSALFLRYFTCKFDPALKKRERELKKVEEAIEGAIKKIPDIMEDKILKLTLSLLRALTRTNYFLGRESIAFKINGDYFAQNLKGIQPAIEIFVYHREFSGVHLRMSAISRGGLRWSDRHDDYRQEIKSLMITQQGKNSIIIPDGAKGGFVIHKERTRITPEYFTKIYRMFIHNLLDLVDNVKKGHVVRHKHMVAYDDDDTYFVVAADKGTADMSDIANAIAIERDFWLGDAFASGGSNGYSHKALGITARGALMSTQRFFIEKGIDFYRENITVVGIGSMNGDVFGNGLLASKMFKLLGAVSHKEIFIDPDPDPQRSYEERKRLFHAKNGSWSHYDKKLISQGGGIFLRSEKEITLSDAVKKMIGSSKKVMSGEELARKLLCMKVQLLFNGGVGTYIKSSDESNLDIGDKQNEAVRNDACDLKADTICEGGNLGLTQRARIEYALNGGNINLDSIDNAAGVNISDHEVNLKILLNILQEKHLLTQNEAAALLHSLSDQVVNLVLWNNYYQALAISRDALLSQKYRKEFIAAINVLECNVSNFNRRDFLIPKDENIHEIIDKKGAIVRPILGSLLSYSKIFLKNVLLQSHFIDEPYALDYLYKYFPKSFVSVYEHEINTHPVKREIIATVIADKIINLQGVMFIAGYLRLSHEKFILKIKSYLIGNELFSANNIRHEIFRNDYLLPATKQYQLLGKIEHTLNFSTRWMVKYLRDDQIDASHILENKDEAMALLLSISTAKYQNIIEGNENFNNFFKVINYLRFEVAAISIKEQTEHSFENVLVLFYLVINEFKILELLGALDDVHVTTASETELRYQILSFVEFIVTHYTKNILTFQRHNETPSSAFDTYITKEHANLHAIQEELGTFVTKENPSLQEIAVIVNKLMVAAL